MSYSEPLINQLKVFFLSIGVGFLICVLYISIHSFFRVLGERRSAIYLADGVFCFITALLSFLFMVLYNNGRVRLHLFIGEAVGFFALYLTAGKRLLLLLSAFADKINSIFGFLFKPFLKFFKLVYRKSAEALTYISTRLSVLFMKREKTSKK